MQGTGTLFLQPVDRLSQNISARALGSPPAPGVLLCLTRGSGTGLQVYRGVWC